MIQEVKLLSARIKGIRQQTVMFYPHLISVTLQQLRRRVLDPELRERSKDHAVFLTGQVIKEIC